MTYICTYIFEGKTKIIVVVTSLSPKTTKYEYYCVEKKIQTAFCCCCYSKYKNLPGNIHNTNGFSIFKLPGRRNYLYHLFNQHILKQWFGCKTRMKPNLLSCWGSVATHKRSVGPHQCSRIEDFIVKVTIDLLRFKIWLVALISVCCVSITVL